MASTAHADFLGEALLNTYPVPPRSAQTNIHDIPVRATLIWAVRGPQEVETVAYAYAGQLVLIEVLDPRYRLTGAWIHADNLTRLNQGN